MGGKKPAPVPGGKGGDDETASDIPVTGHPGTGEGMVPVMVQSSPSAVQFEDKRNFIDVQLECTVPHCTPKATISVDRRSLMGVLRAVARDALGIPCTTSFHIRQHSRVGTVLRTEYDTIKSVHDSYIRKGTLLHVLAGNEEEAGAQDVELILWTAPRRLGINWGGRPAEFPKHEVPLRLASMADTLSADGVRIRPGLEDWCPRPLTNEERAWLALEPARLVEFAAAEQRQVIRDAAKSGSDATKPAEAGDAVEAATPETAAKTEEEPGDAVEAATPETASMAAEEAGDAVEAATPETASMAAEEAADLAVLANRWGPLGTPHIKSHELGVAVEEANTSLGTLRLHMDLPVSEVLTECAGRMRALGLLPPHLQAPAEAAHAAKQAAGATGATKAMDTVADKPAGSTDGAGASVRTVDAVEPLPEGWELHNLALYTASSQMPMRSGHKRFFADQRLRDKLAVIPRFAPVIVACLPIEDAMAEDVSDPMLLTATAVTQRRVIRVRWFDRSRHMLLPVREVLVVASSPAADLAIRLSEASGIPPGQLEFSNTLTFAGLHNIDNFGWYSFASSTCLCDRWFDGDGIVVRTTDDCPAFPPRRVPKPWSAALNPAIVTSAASSASSSGSASAAGATANRPPPPRRPDVGIRITTHKQRTLKAEEDAAAAAAAAAGADSDVAASAEGEGAASGTPETVEVVDEEAYGFDAGEWGNAAGGVALGSAARAVLGSAEMPSSRGMAVAAGLPPADRDREAETRQRLAEEEAARDAQAPDEEVDDGGLVVGEDGELDPFAMMGMGKD